jgi:type III restriction enzyme
VPTDPARSHISDVVLDSGWEESVARAIEKLDGVRCYVRNDHMGFTIPYTYEGVERRYVPDFLVSAEVDDGERPATVVVEVSGEKKPEKEAKVEATRELWLPAVNTHRGFGRWSFVEIDDPTNVKIPLTAAIEAAKAMA